MIRMNKRVRRRTNEIKKKKDHQKEIVFTKIDFEQWRNIYTNIHRWSVRSFLHIHQDDSAFTLHWRHIVCDYDASQLIYRTIACPSINRATRGRINEITWCLSFRLDMTTTSLLQCQRMNKWMNSISVYLSGLLLKLEVSVRLQKYLFVRFASS